MNEIHHEHGDFENTEDVVVVVEAVRMREAVVAAVSAAVDMAVVVAVAESWRNFVPCLGIVIVRADDYIVGHCQMEHLVKILILFLRHPTRSPKN